MEALYDFLGTNTTIYSIRHCHTEKAENDIDRTPSPIGIQQGRKLGLILKDVSFDILLTSPAKRAVMTAQMLNSNGVKSVELSRLYQYDDYLTPEMFKEYGFVSLAEYQKHGYETRVFNYMKAMAEQIGRTLVDHNFKGGTIGIVSHLAVASIAALGFVVHNESAKNLRDLCLNNVMQECDFLKLNLQTMTGYHYTFSV